MFNFFKKREDGQYDFPTVASIKLEQALEKNPIKPHFTLKSGWTDCTPSKIVKAITDEDNGVYVLVNQEYFFPQRVTVEFFNQWLVDYRSSNGLSDQQIQWILSQNRYARYTLMRMIVDHMVSKLDAGTESRMAGYADQARRENGNQQLLDKIDNLQTQLHDAEVNRKEELNTLAHGVGFAAGIVSSFRK